MEYTKKQVSELTELPGRSVQYFTERGVVTPAVDSTGTGNFRVYSEANLYQFALIKQLCGFGMTIDVVRRICIGVFALLNKKGKPYDPKWLEENKPYAIIYNRWDSVGSGREDKGRFVPGLIVTAAPDRSKRPDLLNHPELIGAKSVILVDLYATFKNLMNG